MSEKEMLILAARYARHYIYENRNKLGGTTEFCNLWDILQDALGESEDFPQVPLAEVVEHIKRDLGDIE